MAKNKTEIHVTTVFDGELDATDVFVSLISQKYGKTNAKEYLAKKKDIGYNEDEVQKTLQTISIWRWLLFILFFYFSVVLWRSQNRWSFHSENDSPLHPLLLSRCRAGCRGKSRNYRLFSPMTTKTTEK